jgi:hypothetical protein
MHLYLKKCALVALCISGGAQAATATKAQSALGTNLNDSLDQASEIQSWFALTSGDSSDRPGYPDELAAWFRPDGFGNFAFPWGSGEASRGNEVSGFRTQWWPGWVASPVAWADANESPTSETPSSSGRDGSGGAPQAGASLDPRPASGPAVTIANGAIVEIDGLGGQPVTFAGATGTLKLEDPQAFAGVISGLSGTDAIDLSGFAYGANVKATFLGNATGGTLTVTDRGKTTRIALSGDYLSSTWTLSSDGQGGTIVVDPTVSTNWQDLKVGGGGYVRGLDIDLDGTMVGRTDTNGAYLWNGSAWVQLVTASSMPAAFIAQNPVSTGQGVYEIQMAPSNSSIMYMMFDGYVFKSTNKGTTWSQTSFTQVDPNTSANANDTYAAYGQKMAVDPNNPNIVYVGTEANGMFVSTNGGSTWSSVSAVPAGTKAGITGILFYSNGGKSGGVTQSIYAASYSNGVYQSTNGGATWRTLNGGPTDVEYAAISSSGTYYAVANGGSGVRSYANGKWTELLTEPGQTIATVAVNPSNPNEIVALTVSGYLNVSHNGGSAWSGINMSTSVTSADVPWLAAANKGSNYFYLDVGGAVFSPTENKLVLSAGTGVWAINAPSSDVTSTTPLTWTDMSVGIENLVANAIIVPPSGVPVLASWDRPFFKISNPNFYPSTYGPVNAVHIVAGWSIDYASSDPGFLVGLADWWGVEESGYSTDGGQTWTKFQTDIPGAASSFIGGTIAASTPQNIIWAPADKKQPYYTLNGGQTWSPVTLPGVTSWSGFDWAYYLHQRSVTADRVLANAFYLYYPGQGVFETKNGGQSWTNVYSGYIERNSSWSGYNSTIMSVPGEAGNLFYTGGAQRGSTAATPVPEPFYRSPNAGATWTAVPNVLAVSTFGFGAAAPGQSYPAIYIVGYVNSVFGIWQSVDNAQSWTNIGTYPTGELDQINTISGDPNHYGEVYVGFNGGGYAYLPAGSAQQPVAPTNVIVH